MKRKHADSAQHSGPLVLPAEHALSIAIAAEAALHPPDDASVTSVRIIAEGLVKATILAGSSQGYGARSWLLCIGGAGIGDEPELAAMLGTLPSAPIAVRFDVPFLAMAGVDDAGFVDASFFEGLGNCPSLRQICARAAEWLRGEHLGVTGSAGEGVAAESDDDERRREWLASEAHTLAKVRVIDKFRQLARCPALLNEPAELLPGWIAPSVRSLLRCNNTADQSACCAALLASGVVAEHEPPGCGVYAFDLFTPELCALLMDECDNYEASDLPRRRPNTMNRAGVIVNEIGMHSLMSALLQLIISPLAAHLFSNESFATSLDHHHSFVVHYAADDAASGAGAVADSGLDMHHDASEVTLNVCLGRQFCGSGIRFCGRFGAADHRRMRAVCTHVPGRALLHLGRHRHGADDISSGERLNLIVWARSSAFRGAAAYGHVPPDGYPQVAEDGTPERACLSKANDRDYEQALAALVMQAGA